MKIKESQSRISHRQKLLVAAIAATISGGAFAIDFKTGSGWNGSINTTVSYASSWRAEERDKSLINGMNAAAAGWVPNYVLTGDNTNNPYRQTALTSPPYPYPVPAGTWPVVAAAGVVNGVAKTIYTSAMAGYTGEAKGSTGNMNYGKGDQYSEMLKVISDLSISKGGDGALVRVKGWYDNQLINGSVPWGNQANKFTADKPLSDSGAPALNRFQGIALLDAYAYSSFDLGDNPSQIRVGRQALNWGESLFYQGVNQISPLDVAALRRAGTEIKEALLPIWALSGSIGLSGGQSLEAFYQAKWEASSVDGCGTYWGGDLHISDSPGACNMVAAIGAQNSNRSAYTVPTALGTPSYAKFGEGKKGSNSGQYGLAFRFPIESIDTEFGLYAMQINARLPVLSYRNSRPTGNLPVTPLLGPLSGAPTTGLGTSTLWTATGFLEYPDDIKIYGLSAATTLYGVSWGAELSLQKNVPVQINAADLTIAVGAYSRGSPAGALVSPATTATKQGPMGQAAADAGINGYVQGYERHDKIQLQLNGVSTLPGMLGATNGLFIGEVMGQWNNLPDYEVSGNKRFGRAGEFGYSQVSYGEKSVIFGLLTGAVAGGLQCGENVFGPGFNQDGCKNDGYMTRSAWGYRLRAQLDYPSVFDSGITVSPIVFFAHDIKGMSMDYQLIEGRKTLALTLRLNKNKAHNLDLNYTTYANSATYDPFRDRDNYSIAYSYSF